METFPVPKSKPLIIEDSEISALIRNHFSGCYGTHQVIPEELVFLRDLISNGRWPYIEEFLSPFEGKESHAHSLYLVYRQEYIELLMSTDEINREEKLDLVLDKLRILSPSKEEYKTLCLLLTNSNISSLPEFSKWSIYDSRESLYQQLVRFISRHLYATPPQTNSRLVELISKGLMYEECEKLHVNKHRLKSIPPGHILDLFSWLEHLPDSVHQAPPSFLRISVTRPQTGTNLMQSLTIETTPIPPLYFHSLSAPGKLSHIVKRHEFLDLNVAPPTGIVTGPMSSTSRHPIAEAAPIDATPIHQPSKTTVVDGRNGSIRPKLKMVSKLLDKQVIRSIAYSSDGNFAAVGANSRTLKIIDHAHLISHNEPDPPLELYSQTNYHRGSIYTLDWYGNRLLASGSNDQSIKLLKYDNPNFTVVADIKEFGGTIRELSFMPSSHLLTCGTGQYPLQLIDIEQKVVMRDFKCHDSSMHSITVIDSNVLISGDENGSVTLWDVRSPKEPSLIQPMSHSVTSLSYYKGFLACATSTGQCSLISLSSKRIVTKWSPHDDECRSICYSPNGQWLLSGSYDSTICITDTSTYQWEAIGSHANKVIQARWHPMGVFIASTSADKSACFWKLQS